MNMPPSGTIFSRAALGILALCLASRNLPAQVFVQNNLVSDVGGLAANTDANLKNPWGITFSPTGPFWVSDAGTGKATVYNTSGAPQATVVTIPNPLGPGPAAPTGQVFNSSAMSGAFNGDLFLVATATGTIAGWRPALGSSAETLLIGSPGANYTGLAFGTVSGNAYLYAANFGTGGIEIVPTTGAPLLAGSFTDPGLPSGYSPFNIQNLGGTLFVSYARLGATGEEETGAGKGIVDRFDLNGNLIGRVVSNGGALDAPWGMAIAPAGFGPFGGSLLVGNFGDGRINAFDITSGAFLGTLLDSQGHPIVNDGLWGLTFGNGGSGGLPGTLYITAGIQDEAHGLLASISPGAAAGVPDAAPTAWLMAIAALGLHALGRLRRAEQGNA